MKTTAANDNATGINLSTLSASDWRVAMNMWTRGIDWFVSKLGSRWTVPSVFGEGLTFKTKTAAYNTVTAAVLAEARRQSALSA